MLGRSISPSKIASLNLLHISGTPIFLHIRGGSRMSGVLWSDITSSGITNDVYRPFSWYPLFLGTSVLISPEISTAMTISAPLRPRHINGYRTDDTARQDRCLASPIFKVGTTPATEQLAFARPYQYCPCQRTTSSRSGIGSHRIVTYFQFFLWGILNVISW